LEDALYKEKFSKKPLEETTLQLKTYDGQLLEVKGTITVQVVQGTSKALLPLIVVHWTKSFGKGLAEIPTCSWTRSRSTNCMRESTRLEAILDKYQHVFKDLTLQQC
jgi:hypothetical protein